MLIHLLFDFTSLKRFSTQSNWKSAICPIMPLLAKVLSITVSPRMYSFMTFRETWLTTAKEQVQNFRSYQEWKGAVYIWQWCLQDYSPKYKSSVSVHCVYMECLCQLLELPVREKSLTMQVCFSLLPYDSSYFPPVEKGLFITQYFKMLWHRDAEELHVCISEIAGSHLNILELRKPR